MKFVPLHQSGHPQSTSGKLTKERILVVRAFFAISESFCWLFGSTKMIFDAIC